MIWSLEWRAALAARRLFALNTVVPFALVEVGKAVLRRARVTVDPAAP